MDRQQPELYFMNNEKSVDSNDDPTRLHRVICTPASLKNKSNTLSLALVCFYSCEQCISVTACENLSRVYNSPTFLTYRSTHTHKDSNYPSVLIFLCIFTLNVKETCSLKDCTLVCFSNDAGGSSHL